MPRKEPKEERIRKCMESLKCDYDTAVKVVEDDEIIDAGGKCDWEEEMTPEQKRASRRARMVDRPVATEKVKRTRKEDALKRELVNDIRVLLEGLGATVETTNPERELAFVLNDREFKMTLSAPRAKKAE